MHPHNVNLRTSDAGLALIKRFEGFQAVWYTCPAGKATIGFGHVKRSGDGIEAPISLEFATALLRQDAAHAENNIRTFVAVPLAQHEFDALVALTFNIGIGAFGKSTLLTMLNADDRAGAAKQFDRWVKAGGETLPGLVKRRAAERALFEGRA